jgi:isocitrate dehydrogenase
MSMDRQTVYFIEGDGVGPEVCRAARQVMDAAVGKAYGGSRQLEWVELLAGDKAQLETGSPLPDKTLQVLSREAEVALKGPLATPVGTGFRSLNVTLRQTLDLYACIRPVRYIKGVHSPLKRPEDVDMIVFRENTEDVYAGIEWPAKSPEARKLVEFLRQELGASVDPDSGIGIKPMTERGSKRLVRRALEYALEQGRASLTLVHKGNIMKWTEGAFMQWGYELARDEFASRMRTEVEGDTAGSHRLVVKDRIADNMFQQVLLNPLEYDVIATSNLNGDYLSDALAAQVGGLGLAPGANMSDRVAVFEATHGTAPDIAGMDMVNPCSLILSGSMLLEHLGWTKGARGINEAVENTILDRAVTPDLARQIPEARSVGCREMTELVLGKLQDATFG